MEANNKKRQVQKKQSKILLMTLIYIEVHKTHHRGICKHNSINQIEAIQVMTIN